MKQVFELTQSLSQSVSQNNQLLRRGFFSFLYRDEDAAARSSPRNFLFLSFFILLKL